MSKMIIPITYKLMVDGVKRSDGACIPACSGNRDWKTYLEWLDQGHLPEPEYTQDELDKQAMHLEIANLKSDLRSAMVWEFRMIIELFRLMKSKTTVRNSDVNPVLLTKANQWISKLERLKEIDE